MDTWSEAPAWRRHSSYLQSAAQLASRVSHWQGRVEDKVPWAITRSQLYVGLMC